MVAGRDPRSGGFTLIELLLVITIMGIMGTAAVGGYRAMQRGMEERGVMQNVNQFVRSAYQRAQIDRTPVAVYFWNETLREESENDTLVVVGRAVAVRRAGRLSEVQGSSLYDEFGDLRHMRFMLDDDTDAYGSSGADEKSGMFLYPMNGERDGQGMTRSIVAQTAEYGTTGVKLLDLGKTGQVPVYHFTVINPGGVSWKRGDGYGTEFAEITLPHNYIFGSQFQTRTSTPVSEIAKISFKPGSNSGNGATGGVSGSSTIQVSSLRPGASGDLSAKPVGTSKNPES